MISLPLHTSQVEKSIPKLSRKAIVGMVQINNSFSKQNYLPLSVGFLVSYAKRNARNFSDFDFLVPIYKRIKVDDAVNHLRNCDIACFSTYVWNFNVSCEIAKRLKAINPDIVILFGGCHIPDNQEKGLEKFLRKYDFIDLAAVGEGEIVFTLFLENYPTKSWSEIPSIAFLDKGQFIFTPGAPRIEDLNDIPSPYLGGYFDDLVDLNPDERWIGLFETNRGCPFKCTFCDWGVNSKNRMSNYDLEERLFKEIDWFSRNKVSFVYCCDANFGMYKDRDYAIANHFVENKNKYGYPERFSVQNTKNSTDSSFQIQKLLVNNGLDKGVLLAFQSLYEPTLSAIKRQNIKLDTFFDLQKRFTSEGITTFSDIILGLPEETYETFVEGVSNLIEHGQHNRIQFNNLSILPNAPMVEDIERYGLKLVESKIINIHGSLSETEEITETQNLVVGSSSMPPDQWVMARSFGFMTALLHFDKLCQINNIVLNVHYGVTYKDIVNSFLFADSKEYPIINSVSQFFIDKSKNIQNGGAEFCESKEWLGIWWPADELAYINLASSGNLDGFYEEAFRIYKSLSNIDESILLECIKFNRELMKMPFDNRSREIHLSFNIHEVYLDGLMGNKKNLIEGDFNLQILRDESWKSWLEWCEKVIWFGNKRGDYIYKWV